MRVDFCQLRVDCCELRACFCEEATVTKDYGAVMLQGSTFCMGVPVHTS
jgi:hypothetical protein